MVDANILFSALIKDSHIRHFLVLSDHTFYLPEYVFEEVKEHSSEIEEKTGLSKEEILELLQTIIIFSNIKIIPIIEFQEYVDKAKEICPDNDDVAYFALALKMKCNIWSNDKRLNQQTTIKIYNTYEILNNL